MSYMFPLTGMCTTAITTLIIRSIQKHTYGIAIMLKVSMFYTDDYCNTDLDQNGC